MLATARESPLRIGLLLRDVHTLRAPCPPHLDFKSCPAPEENRFRLRNRALPRGLGSLPCQIPRHRPPRKAIYWKTQQICNPRRGGQQKKQQKNERHRAWELFSSQKPRARTRFLKIVTGKPEEMEEIFGFGPRWLSWVVLKKTGASKRLASHDKGIRARQRATKAKRQKTTKEVQPFCRDKFEATFWTQNWPV